MKYTYDELAKMIDHSLLHPAMTDQELEDGCQLAAEYSVASVCIKPYFVGRAAELLKGTGVKVAAVVGFPHGGSATEVKSYETEIACREGAEEIDMVINIGKALSGDWDYVERDVKAVCDEAHHRGATEHDLRLMRASCSPKVQVKAAGGVRDLDGLILVRDLGATRCGATATAAMLDEYRRRAAADSTSAPSDAPPAKLGAGKY